MGLACFMMAPEEDHNQSNSSRPWMWLLQLLWQPSNADISILLTCTHSKGGLDTLLGVRQDR